MLDRQLRMIRNFCISILTLCFSGIAWAEPRMGLVAPGAGWALQDQGTVPNRNDHLFWTNDDGGTWRDITPLNLASKEIADVFFLDASRGWALSPARGKEFTGASNVSGFDLAITTDGGADWTLRHVTLPPENHGWSGRAKIFFLDSSHGWLNLELALHDWAVGTLLATSDGGATWNQVRGFNVDAGYGPIHFTDLQNGWIAGGPYGQQHLYATHDGGGNWQNVPLPSNVPGSAVSQVVTPLFRDGKHGFLPVTYTGTDPSGSDFKAMALFSTDDAGRTWHFESSVNLAEDRGVLPFTIAGSQAVAPKLSGHSGLSLLKFGPGGKATETEAVGPPAGPSNATPLGLVFSDATHGWASLSDGRLLSTADGGVSWKDITVSRKTTSMSTLSKSMVGESQGELPLESSLVSATPTSVAASSTITTYKSRHIGFDVCTLPTTSQMTTWWNSSPYFDYGVYVGGVNTHCASVTSSWVKTVTGKGWGLIPIWVGPQAPCTCARGTWPNCTQTWTTISTTGGAYAQGQSEADAATASRGAMGRLGLGSGSPVYLDIENYSPSATCNGSATGSYVNSFLSGWVAEVQHNGYIAGIYGNPAPATDWHDGGSGYGPVSPFPTDVWIAKYDNHVTIWGLATLNDAAWPRDQREHQYLANQTVNWGGVQLQVDNDIEDADVTGGNGTKSYSFNYTTIDYPGGNGTSLLGINNSGQIVGYYGDPTTGNVRGFLYNQGLFLAIDFPNATFTIPYGVNNAGHIVGLYGDQVATHGFLLQGSVYTSLDYPGAIQTYVFGINDDDQISGYYTDSQSVNHGFQYQATTFTSFDYPLAPATEAYGLNGDAQIAGGCPDAPSFLYAQGTFSSPPLECPAGLNNNSQITGSLGTDIVFEHEGSYVTIAVPGASNTNTPYSPSDFIQNSQTTAKVAFVGGYAAANGVLHGYLATSQ